MEKFFLYVDETSILAEIIPEENPDLPGVAIEDRYTADFLARCVQRTPDQMAEESIKVGMMYDKESDTFSALPEPEPELEPKPEGYTITEEEVSAAYKEGINNVE